MISAWIESGRIIDLILGWIVVEACVLMVLLRSRPRAERRAWLVNLAAGACLLLALRSVVHDAEVVMIGLWLTLALVAHLADLLDRFRDRSRSGTGNDPD